MQKKILQVLQKEGVITTQLIAGILKKPRVTVSRNLQKLVTKGCLVRCGKGRGCYYIQTKGLTLQYLEQKKNRLDSFRPFPSEIVNSIAENLSKKFIYSSNAIEGSQITLRETDLILSGLSVRKPENMVQEVKNQNKAIELIKSFAQDTEPLSEKFILRIQKIVTSDTFDIFLNGKYRNHEVGILGSRKTFCSEKEVPKKMKNLVSTIQKMEEKKYFPPLIASYLHYHITAIHPFFDGNGRTARLLMNAILLKHHYPIAFIPFSERPTYYKLLQQADQGDRDLLDAYIFACVGKSIDMYLDILEE